jgi:hypothetical protein
MEEQHRRPGRRRAPDPPCRSDRAPCWGRNGRSPASRCKTTGRSPRVRSAFPADAPPGTTMRARTTAT